MAIVQNTYIAQPVAAYAGLVANGEDGNRISRTVADAGGLAFGRAAFRGADDFTCTGTPAAGAGNFLGFTIAHEAQGLLPGQTEDIYAQRQSAAILSDGVIWVTAGEDITRGAQVYVTSAGAIVDTVGSNTIAPGWFFDTAALSGGLVRIAKR